MVDLKEPKLMLRDLSCEKLDEVHGSGYYDYLDDPGYTDNVTRAVARMILDRTLHRASVLDVGCGTGALAGELHPSMSYFGIDASYNAIRKAIRTHGQFGKRQWNVSRIENFCDLALRDCDKFDAIHFGNVLCCLIHPDARLSFVERYVEKFRARFIVVSDLERLDSTPLKDWYDLLEGETFHLNIPDQPDSKQHRKVEIYRTGVKRDG